MATLSYTEIDRNDRQYFDHILTKDIERFAFARFFERVQTNFARNKREYRSFESKISRLIGHRSPYWNWSCKAVEQGVPHILDRSGSRFAAVAGDPST